VPPPKIARPTVAPVRAKLAADDPFTPAAANDPAAMEAARKRSIRVQLAQLEELEAKEQDKFDELVGQSKYARIGLTLLAYGCACSGLAAAAYFVFVITTLTSTPFPPLLWAAGGCLALNWLLSVAGFGVCCGGPKAGVGLGMAGVGVTALHLGFLVITSVVLLNQVSLQNVGYGGEVRAYIVENLLLSNAFSNTSVLVDLPVYLITGMLERPVILVIPFLGGSFEFAKLSVIGMLSNRLASEAKAHDLAHQGMRFVFRIFTAILVAAILKVVIFVGVKFVGGDPMTQDLFAIPILMATNGYYLWWAFACFAQYQTMTDIAGVTTADRLIDKRDRLDVV
jgi:hypothetical protein